MNAPNIIPHTDLVVHARTRRAGRKPGKIVREGSVRVRIFPVAGAGRRVRFEVRYQFAGRMLRKVFPDRADAEQHAREQALALSQGRHAGRGLTAEQSAFTLAVIERGERFQRTTGDTRFAIVILDEHFAAAETAHAHGHTLRELVEIGLRHSPRTLTARPVPDVVAEFLDDVKARSLAQKSSLAHWRSLRSRLQKFSAAFTGPVGALEPVAVGAWLHGVTAVAKTANHHRAAVLQLVRFAAARKYARPEIVAELKVVAAYKILGREPTPYTARELTKILHQSQISEPAIVPYIVLNAFCWVRSSEIMGERGGMEWSDIDLVAGEVHVRAAHSKVGEHRRITLKPNALAWLRRYAAKEGPVCPVKDPDQVLRRVRRLAGVTGKTNGGRSAGISHEIAATGDYVRVADQAGTSVAKIKSNYLKRPTARDSALYWSILPADYTQPELFAPVASPSRHHLSTAAK